MAGYGDIGTCTDYFLVGAVAASFGVVDATDQGMRKIHCWGQLWWRVGFHWMVPLRVQRACSG
jgi:hypothetical protein